MLIDIAINFSMYCILILSIMINLSPLVGEDPLAVFRWALVRATFRAAFAFRAAGRRGKRAGKSDKFIHFYMANRKNIIPVYWREYGIPS